MNEWVETVRPTLLVIIAAAAVSRIIAEVVNWTWHKVGKPAMDATLLHDVHSAVAEVWTEVRSVRERLDLEFANGVPPDSDTYVPLRKRVDAAHAKTDDQIETLFEMYGTSHDEMVNIGRQVARHELWIGRQGPEAVTSEGA